MGFLQVLVCYSVSREKFPLTTQELAARRAAVRADQIHRLRGEGIDLRKPVAPAAASAIYRAWLNHAVLLFRGHELTQEDLI
jgi:hypothetical protein